MPLRPAAAREIADTILRPMWVHCAPDGWQLYARAVERAAQYISNGVALDEARAERDTEIGIADDLAAICIDAMNLPRC